MLNVILLSRVRVAVCRQAHKWMVVCSHARARSACQGQQGENLSDLGSEVWAEGKHDHIAVAVRHGQQLLHGFDHRSVAGQSAGLLACCLHTLQSTKGHHALDNT